MLRKLILRETSYIRPLRLVCVYLWLRKISGEPKGAANLFLRNQELHENIFGNIF